ncbi:uncharacterized protein LOC108209308 [Daucus carota subsp. sativus]|uniref:Uncharacterized protein n=1 Tax=Daucus carota subsp. sativus TaxID=79200 RepID=A0A166DX11_DAUCS|nr:PREDICTED: MATH and LRR domain-containing protein PFE0570w [Daucus carota subsp. sativus]
MNNPSQSENPDPYSTQLQQHQFPQSQNPISSDHENNPQTPEVPILQSPQKSDPTQLDEGQEEREEEEECSGMVYKSNTKLANRRNLNRRKKAFVYQKQKAIDKKVHNLLQLGTLVPFVPPERFDFDKHAALLKRLGLWDFVHIEFDEVIRDDLVGQFIVSYDSAKKCCFVNGIRVDVNRTKFARVLKLPSPIKKDKVVGSVAEAVIDLEVSEECVEFVENFVWSWLVLRGGEWIMPNEVNVSLGLIRDGHLEKIDWATLIWVMVENELKQKDQLPVCYYASHMQYFIKSQRKDFFDEESEDFVINETMKEEEKALNEEEIHKVKVEDIKKDEDLLEEVVKVNDEVVDDKDLLKARSQEVNEKEVKKGLHEVEVEVAELQEGPPEEAVDAGVKKDLVGSFHDLSMDRDKFVTIEPNIGLTSGWQDIAQKEEIKDNMMMTGEAGLEMKNDGKHSLQPCTFREGSGYNGNKEIKQEVRLLETEEEEHMEEGEGMQEWENREEGEHMESDDVDELEGDEIGEQLEDEDEDEDDEDEYEYEDEDVDEEEPEDVVECDMAPNHCSVAGTDLTGDPLQGFETTQLPLNLQGQQFQKNSSLDLFTSNAETQVMMGCPSMLGHGHKRVFEYEQGTSHLDGSKRIRHDVGCGQNTSDFSFCMDQVRQYMEKAKIIYEEKSQDCNQVNENQQYLLHELQRRDSIIENLRRNKNEELQKKDREIYRLERELGLLGELVTGYREALKVNRNMFFEYRQRCKLPEEPIYKDAGSGGLVLSTTDLENQRQQQENEDRLKRLLIEQKYNEALEGYVNQFQVLFRKVEMIYVNRLTPVVNEVELLKNLYAARRRAPETPVCVPPETTCHLHSNLENDSVFGHQSS